MDDKENRSRGRQGAIFVADQAIQRIEGEIVATATERYPEVLHLRIGVEWRDGRLDDDGFWLLVIVFHELASLGADQMQSAAHHAGHGVEPLGIFVCPGNKS
jgi:hypothetical protein